MSNYGTIRRPSTTTSTTATDQPQDPNNSSRKYRTDFNLLFPFNIPTTPEAAAVRIIRNLSYFGLFYTLFIWVGLFISLIPRRKLSLILLVVMTVVTTLYLVLLRLLPISVVVYKIFGKRFVLPPLAILTAVLLIVTKAGIHLLVSLAIGIPIVLVHAVLRVRDALFVGEEASAAGELVPLVFNKSTLDDDELAALV